MGIKPALGWLGLLLFTTTAQAEGTRDLLRGRSTSRTKAAPLAIVTAKTKAPAPITSASASMSRATVAVVQTIVKPRSDYDASTHAGVPLDSPIAKERGLDKGLVQMVFEHQRRTAFHVDHERIRRVVRLADDRATAFAARPNDHIDVIDTEDGVVVVDTAGSGAGMFVTSDVYVFPPNATLDQRIGALENVLSSEHTHGRLREALVAAEWLVTTNARK